MYELLEDHFIDAVNYTIMAIEMVGVIVLVVYAVRATFALFKSTYKCKRLLSTGITTALSFLLGGEVLKTIVAPDWKDIGMTCAILLMRAAVTVLLHWEHQQEEPEE
jgi:uncharacterized membrane protein